MKKNWEPGRAAEQFVKDLQTALAESDKDVRTLAKRVDQVNKEMARRLGGGVRARIEVDKRTRDGELGLRVTCPMVTTATFAPEGDVSGGVRFLLTRPRSDGVPETRELGTARYPDGDGTWNLRFTSERFARDPDDPVVLHAEVLGQAGQMLAAYAIPLIV